MKLAILLGISSFIGYAASTPTSRAVQLPAEFKWVSDNLGSTTLADSIKKCYAAVDAFTETSGSTAAFQLQSDCYPVGNAAYNVVQAFNTNGIPSGVTTDKLDLVLKYIVEAKFEAQFIPLLQILSKKDALIRSYFGNVGWTWFRPETMRTLLIEPLQAIDQYLRHSLTTTAFLTAPSLPAYKAYIEAAWASLGATRPYRPTPATLPAAYDEAVQWDITEKQRGMFAAIAGLKAYKDKSGLKTVLATGTTLAGKISGWYTNNGFTQPSTDLANYPTPLEAASMAEARLQKYEIKSYQPLLFPWVDALMEKKALFASLSDQEKKDLNAVIDLVWKAWANRDKGVMSATAPMEAPSYMDALNSGSKIYEAYGKWKA